MVNHDNSITRSPHGIPRPPQESSSNIRRRRPKTTVFDGPLTPNFVLFGAPANVTPPLNPNTKSPRVAFVSSSTNGKVVIPVGSNKSTAPTSLPTSGGPPTRAFVMDARGLRSSGCLQNYCYEWNCLSSSLPFFLLYSQGTEHLNTWVISHLTETVSTYTYIYPQP